MKSPVSSDFATQFGFAVFGSVLSVFIDATPIKDVFNRPNPQTSCIDANLPPASTMRRQAVAIAHAYSSRDKIPIAVRLSIEAHHVEANRMFKIASDCGSAMAKAHLGAAYCMGWGVRRDWTVGMSLLREAGKSEPLIAHALQREPDKYCIRDSEDDVEISAK